MSAAPQAEQPRPAPEPGDASRPLSWQEHQAAGDAAWNEALARTSILRPEGGENPLPLDEATIDLYEQVSAHMKAVIFLGPDGPPDPFNLMKLGGSQAARAEATPVGVFEHGWVGDKQSGLQDAARSNLQRAAAMLMGDEVHTAQALAGEMTDVDPSEVMPELAVEAADEASTGELKAVGADIYAGKVTPEQLEAEGVEGMERYIWERGGEPDSGPEFMLRLSAKAVEQLTGEHQLPGHDPSEHQELQAA
jgi:hypothetical protein